MPRVKWPLHFGCPKIQVVLTRTKNKQPLLTDLLADTGAGTAQAGFELVLDELDCLACGGLAAQPIALAGAYSGSFPSYLVRIQVPALGFDRYVAAVGVPQPPADFGVLRVSGS